jgi:biopolymer transport protein ExbD
MIDPLKNRLVITQAGSLVWNGTTVSDDSLRSLLAATQAMARTPELQLQPDAEARYERVDQVLAMTKRAHVTGMGFVGNEAYGRF